VSLPDFVDDDCWIHVTASTDISSGDVLAGVPLLQLNEQFALLESEGSDGTTFSFPVTFSIGVVLSTEPYCVIVPITTQNDVADEERFAQLIELARHTPLYCRLPELPGLWVGNAFASLFQPTALPHHILNEPPPERLAGMTDEAKAVLKERYVASVAQ
jgi:hypothetical protein